MRDRLDTKVLIALVRARPALWDRSLASHADPGSRSAAWRAVCRALCPEYDAQSSQGRRAYVRSIKKKWTNIRDAWRKSAVEKKTKKNAKTYVYNEHLRFLEKNLFYVEQTRLRDLRERSAQEMEAGGQPSLFDDSEDSSEARRGSSTGRAQQEESPHICFMRGLLPTLGKLTDDEVLEFQAGVIQLLLEIRKAKTAVDGTALRCGHPASSLDINEFINNMKGDFIGA